MSYYDVIYIYIIVHAKGHGKSLMVMVMVNTLHTQKCECMVIYYYSDSYWAEFHFLSRQSSSRLTLGSAVTAMMS